MILLQDVPWSFADLVQMIGRIWRQGQDKDVKVYSIYACCTPDDDLQGMSDNKAFMQKAFIGAIEQKQSSDNSKSIIFCIQVHCILIKHISDYPYAALGIPWS
jgi:SNF2 family DNA or RNA helicase